MSAGGGSSVEGGSGRLLSRRSGSRLRERSGRLSEGTGRSKRLSVADARVAAVDLLASKGHRDRKSGTFAVAGPEEDAKVPKSEGLEPWRLALPLRPALACSD